MFPTPKLALVIAGNFSEDEENTDPGILLGYLPDELARRCEIKEWSCQPSTHYSMSMTLAMEEMFESLVSEGYTGIITVCGSGVMEEMAYLVNLLWRFSEPVIFVNLKVKGREGLRDGVINLHCSVLAAMSSDARDKGVMVCSGGELFSSDDVILADPASPDSAFQSPVYGAVGKLLNDEIKFFGGTKRPSFLARRPVNIPYVEIMWASLGGGARLISSLVSEKELSGLVLAGFGSGSVPPSWVPHIRNIIRKRVPVVITSRCVMSSVRKTNEFEGAFEKLIEMGAMSGGVLSPLRARIRLAIGLSAGLTDNGIRLYMLNQPVDEETPELYK